MTDAELLQKLRDAISNLENIKRLLDRYDMSDDCDQQLWLDATREIDSLAALAKMKTGES